MHLQGELTAATAPALLKHAGALIAGGTINLSAVTRADSAGVSLLLELQRRAMAAGKPLTFSHCPEQLRGLLTFFELEEALPIRETA